MHANNNTNDNCSQIVNMMNFINASVQGPGYRLQLLIEFNFLGLL